MAADRRTLLKALGALTGAGAIAACNGKAQPTPPPFSPLKNFAPYRIGVCGMSVDFNDPQWTQMVGEHFTRFVPEWEQKMEYVLQKDGSLQLDRAMAQANFARAHGMTMHGHTLVWYAQDGEYFQRLANRPEAFLTAYADYIGGVVKAFRGVCDGWDVVNEPILDDGSGLRDCLWRKVLGDDYVGLAFEAARQADPNAVLFLNDYNLEYYPAKRRRFLQLCEHLLKTGAPLTGVATQTHVAVDVPKGAIRDTIRDLGALGLKVYVSEIDISLRADKPMPAREGRLEQLRILEEIVTAYDRLRPEQQHGITFWALRDKDSWLNRDKKLQWSKDEPVLFDDAGAAKPMAHALVDLWAEL